MIDTKTNIGASIDTVKFVVTVDDELFKIIKKDSLETKQHDHRLGVTKLNYFNSKVHIPSYFRGIIVYIDNYKDNTVFFETSLPKLLFNNNLRLITIPEAIFACEYLRNIFIENYGTFPNIYDWRINRMDLCYAWYLENQEHVIMLNNLLSPYIRTRKKLKFYPGESIYASSELGATKFYNKLLEYKKHDFKDLQKINLEYAYQLLLLSENIYRFEIELRRRQLKKEFDTGILSIENLFKEGTITKILSQSFSNTVDNKINFSSNLDNYKKLINMYGSTRAAQLHTFYKDYYSSDPDDRAFLETQYSRMTIYRNRMAIKKAGLGIKINDNSLSYLDFKIPSKNNVNNYLQPLDLPQGKSINKVVGV
jgi:hypothetical protein